MRNLNLKKKLMKAMKLTNHFHSLARQKKKKKIEIVKPIETKWGVGEKGG